MKKLILSVLTVLTMLLVTSPVKANQLNFSVSPVIPENQAQPKLSYFDLLMKAGEKQTVAVDLANSTDKKVTVNVSIANATTNINGVVEYSPNKIKPDKSLKYQLEKLLKGPKQVILQPKSSQKVEFQVTMPAENFTGLIAGGLTFKQEESEVTANKSKANGVTVNNDYQFVIGFLLQQKTDIVAPVLDLTAVKADLTDSRNSILANFENSAAGYLKNMTVSAKVTKKSADKSLYSLTKSDMSMAPNSNFDLPMSLDKQRFEPGTYTYTAVVYGQKSADGQYTYGKDANGQPQHYAYRWTFSQDFTITGKQAQALNAKDVSVSPDYSWIYWLIGLGLILLALLLWFILWKRRKKDDEA